MAGVGLLCAMTAKRLTQPPALSTPQESKGPGLGFSLGAKTAMGPRKRRLSPKSRRALEMLASRPFGLTERLMLARGFSRRMLIGLVKQGLATVMYEMVQPDGKILEVVLRQALSRRDG
jgi:hypothetical protein